MGLRTRAFVGVMTEFPIRLFDGSPLADVRFGTQKLTSAMTASGAKRSFANFPMSAGQ